MYDAVRDVLGPKWSLEILELLDEKGPYRYSEVEAALNTSSDVVSNRLDILEAYGLIEREEETIRNVSYSITPLGKDVLGVSENLRRLLDN